MFRFSKIINLAGVVFLVVVLGMVAANLLKKSVYNPKLGINILLISSDGMGIVAIRPETGLVSLIRLPDNLIIPTSSTGAIYQVNAFYKVGLPVKDPNNEAMKSVGQALGVTLSAWVKMNSAFGLAGLRESLFSLSSHTSLNFFDRYRLAKEIANVSTKKTVLSLSLPNSVVDGEDEIDGQKILKLNPAIFTWSRNQWVSDAVLGEGAEVTIVNASGKEGLARLVAHQVESAGIRVIDLVVAKEQSDKKCLLLGDLTSRLLTIDFLTKSFSCQVETKMVPTDFVDRDVKSDLVMILGKGF